MPTESPTPTLPVKIRLTLEIRMRGPKRARAVLVKMDTKAVDCTIDDFKPFLLERRSEYGLGEGCRQVSVQRLHIQVDDYDPETRTVDVSASVARTDPWYDRGYTGWLFEGFGFEYERKEERI